MENEKEIETGNEVAEEKVDDTPDNSVKEGTGESAAEDNKQTDEVDTSIPEKEESENEETENEKQEIRWNGLVLSYHATMRQDA